MLRFSLILIIVILFLQPLTADDGYRLWLKYDRLSDNDMSDSYRELLTKTYIPQRSPVSEVITNELNNAISGLLGKRLTYSNNIKDGNMLVVAVKDKLPSSLSDLIKNDTESLNDEGYLIKSLQLDEQSFTVITANTDIGLLYGTFAFIRLLQTNKDISSLEIISNPKIKIRVLNHWDNLNRTIERGYAGFSLWDWQKLPGYIHNYYRDYARANASIGINGTVLNNVNANAQIMTPLYLRKVAALADVFRPYGIKVYLSIRFSAPIDIGGLKDADPLNPEVQEWWKNKVREVYDYIPDFGGFLVKANSEGQPGPGDYGRTHADGANMLADALKPHNGIVMWRAFVYDNNNKEDRAKQAFNEFTPLDGTFRENILVQVKNGPIDFQPREPFHPLFGAMPRTSLMMEFQITQEYLGFATHLVYLADLYKEVLESDTYIEGKGSTIARIIDGSLQGQKLTGIAGVANTGTDRNWTGHLFGQANWYAFGRLSWDHKLKPESIADEWIKMTISKDPEAVGSIKSIMLSSRETTVNYMTPLGLHHIMGWSHHYGPAPWIKDKPRADWTSVYYHRADRLGIGFDRTKSGSNAVSQYAEPVNRKFSSLETCPENLLLWFHHVPWKNKMKSGKTLWAEICYHYYGGADQVSEMISKWNHLEGRIDGDIFRHVSQMLNIQKNEAIWWRNACVLYFQTFSGLPIPEDLEKPDKSLKYYQNLEFPFAPM
jgi:alpha-glucuronidase